MDDMSHPVHFRLNWPLVYLREASLLCKVTTKTAKCLWQLPSTGFIIHSAVLLLALTANPYVHTCPKPAMMLLIMELVINGVVLQGLMSARRPVFSLHLYSACIGLGGCLAFLEQQWIICVCLCVFSSQKVEVVLAERSCRHFHLLVLHRHCLICHPEPELLRSHTIAA